MLLSANWRDEFISPGPLARQHAQLLEQSGAAPQCAACHSAGNGSVATWTKSMLLGHAGHTQSQLCMNCHEQTINPQLALAAHNLPPADLQQLTKNVSGTSSGAPRELACAVCHREHHGAEFNLAAMDNGSCQACHAQRYESFAADHPDFGNWPYERRTRIAFDHASHQTKHFIEKQEAFTCQMCHVPSASQSAQLLVAYEQSCAKCHDEKIATSVAQGVPMFVLPILDVDALRAGGFNIGAWPEGATGDFDGRLPPPMKMLLAADPAAAKAMATLGPDFEFIDVDPGDVEQLQAVADLAVGIRKLFAELSQSGPQAIRARVQASLGRSITNSQLDALTAGLSVDTLRPAVAAWFPNVDAGKNAWPSGQVSDQQETASTLSFAPAGSWVRNDATYSINYHLTGHADPVLTEWLALFVDTPGVHERPLELALFREMSKPTAPGLCVSCHSVEQRGPHGLVINWRADDPQESPRTFTRFSHAPHLTLPELANCTACHAIDTAANTTASYTDLDPHRFVSDFRPLSKRECAACHTATAAGDSCQSCHRYHVERIVDQIDLPEPLKTSSAILRGRH